MAQSVVINGVTYSDVPEVDIPKSGGGTATFYDTADADAGQGDVLSGKTYYKDGKKTGSMTNNGDTSGDISTKAGTVTIPAGYTSGGTVAIDSTEQGKIVAGNIKSGVTILGVSGDSNVVDTTVASGGAAAAQIMSGYSAYVNGSKVDGSATVPTVSQDSTTKVLSIA
jgi:hypothetical protein